MSDTSEMGEPPPSPAPRPATGRWLLLGGLFLLSLAVRGWFLWRSGFDGLFGQDPFGYYNYFLELRPALLAGAAPPPFHWPLGYPMLMFFASLATGTTPFAGQLVSLLLGSCIAPLVWLLVRRLAPAAPGAALAAGAFAAIAHFDVILSLYVMADIPGLFFALLAALALLRYCEHHDARWLAAAAALLALAIATRWGFALLAFPLGAAAGLAHLRARSGLRLLALHALVAIGVGGAVLGVQFLPGLLRGDGVSHAGNLKTYTWDPRGAFKHDFENSDGHFHYARNMAHYYASPAFDPSYIPLVFTPLLLLGLLALRRAKPVAAVLVVGWLLTMYLFFIGVSWQNSRFALSYFPPLLALAGLGADFLVRAPTRRSTMIACAAAFAWLCWATPAPWWLCVGLGLPACVAIGCARRAPQPLYRVAIVALLLLGAGFSFHHSQGNIRWTLEKTIPRYIDAARWAAEQVPEGHTLFAFGITLTIEHYTNATPRELFHTPPEEFAQTLARQGTVYLYADTTNLATQWQDHNPGKTLRWAQENTTLTPLGERLGMTLYRIEQLP